MAARRAGTGLKVRQKAGTGRIAMILSEAMTLMSVHLGFRTVNSEFQGKVVAALDWAQKQLERGPRYPWFLISEESTIQTETGEQRLPLPDDFLHEVEGSAMYYVPTDTSLAKVELRKFEDDYLESIYPRGEDGSRGSPKAYSRMGNYFLIWPVPDSEYDIEMKYYEHDATIASLAVDGENKWLKYAPDTIIGKAGGYLATGLRDMVALQAFRTMESEGRTVLTTEDTLQEVENRELLMGGDV